MSIGFLAAVLLSLSDETPPDEDFVPREAEESKALEAPPLLTGWHAVELDEADSFVAQGRLAEAEARLVVLLGREENPEALLRLARMCRWTGRPLAAARYAERALGATPRPLEVRTELALANAALGRPSEASQLATGLRSEQAKEVDEAVRKARAPRLSVAGTAYTDSNGITRFAPRVSVDLALPVNFRLLLGGGLTTLDAPTAETQRALTGAQLSWRIGRAELSGGWVGHFGDGALHEGFGAFTFRFTDEARAAIRVRRRPFFEAAPSLSTGEDTFHSAGTGGAVSLAGLERRGLDEVIVSASFAPFRATYLYADGRAFSVTDGNLGGSLAAGVGFDVLAATRATRVLSITLRLDTFITGFAEGRRSYFSPAFLDSHSPGVSAQVRLGEHVNIGGDGGATYSFSGGQTGYFAGLGAGVSLSETRVTARAQVRDDPWFASRRLWLELTRSFP